MQFTCQMRRVRERIHSKTTDCVDPGRRICILPNYFGSFCGKSFESREERKVAHMFSSHSSWELSSEAAGRKDPCGSVEILCPCARIPHLNLCPISHFCSSWTSSNHSSTILIHRRANRHLHGRKIPDRSPRQNWLPSTCMFLLFWTRSSYRYISVSSVTVSFLFMCIYRCEFSHSALATC